MKRKLSFLEFGLLMVPLLAFALLTAQSQIRNAWNTWFWGGTVLKGDVYGLGFSPDSKTLAICTWDHNVRKGRLDFMDIPSQRVRNSVDLRGPGNVIWSPDGKRLVLSNGLGCAIWDTTLNRWLLRRRAVPRASEYVSGWQSPDVLRLRIATYARPRSKPLWQEARLDVRSGALQTSTPATTVPAEEKPLRVSPDGRWKIAISDTRYISKPATKRAGWWVTGHQEGARLQLWDKQTGKLARTFDGDMFTDAAFQSKTTVAAYARIHSNGGFSSTMPGTAVCTLSIGNSRPQWELLAPGERAIQFSRSGRFLLTSAKNRIRLRDTRDWSVAEEISHRGAGVSRAEFSPDGRHLAYATYSPNVVRIATLSNVDTVDPGSRGQIQEKH